MRGARLDDPLEITVELAQRKRTYLMLKQRALRGAEPMAEALVQAACVRCEDFKPSAIPAALAAQLPEPLNA